MNGLTVQHKIAFTCLSLICIVCCVGCATINPSPLTASRFLPNPSRLEVMPDERPYQFFWCDMSKLKEIKSQYTKVFVRPVNMDIFREKLDESGLSKSDKKQRLEEAGEVEKYTEQRFKQAITTYDSPPIPLQLVDAIPSDGFVIDLALVDIEPTRSSTNVLGTITSIFLPVGRVLKFTGKGSVAIEGIIRDGDNMIPVAMFRDRKVDKTDPFNIKDFQEYGHIRTAIDAWAKTFADLMLRPLQSTVPSLFKRNKAKTTVQGTDGQIRLDSI